MLRFPGIDRVWEQLPSSARLTCHTMYTRWYPLALAES